MNKYIILAAFAAPACVLASFAQTPESMADDVAVQAERLAVMLEDCNANNVNRKAPEIEKAVTKLMTTYEELTQLLREDEEGKKKLQENQPLKEKGLLAIGHLFGAAHNVAEDGYYGSELLKKTLNRLMEL